MRSPIGPKSTPLRLDPPSYERLRHQVLRRDGWRCQGCGTMSNLEVHHKQFRGSSGNDSEENLITLCAPCHHKIHQLAKRKWDIGRQE
jgi:5-methylcytosine-specific restriction endonuclease McrA